MLATLAAALADRGTATWVVAGGSTPRRLYELLGRRPEAVDWRRVELFWSDERCVPPGDPRSNYRLVEETLLAGLVAAPPVVHRVAGERPAAVAARLYGGRVAAALRRGPFDLVLLGLGADGHVASLFPPLPGGGSRLVTAVDAPVEPHARVTLTPAALTRSRRTLFLVSGAAKGEALRAALAPGGGRLPSGRARSATGETLWLADRAAAGAVVA